MFSLKTRILAKHFRPDIDFDNLNAESLAWLKLIEAKTGGNPIRNATISNGIAYFDGVTVSQPLVSLKLNIPVTQTGSGTPYPGGAGKNKLPNNMVSGITNGITYTVNDDATYMDLFECVKKDRYFPRISGNNVVWVLGNEEYRCIFSYFTFI